MTGNAEFNNVLFIVWDACRVDYARTHAPNLSRLAAENLTFANAIAPSCWSLPSHASLFTGQSPHEHGIYTATDEMDDVTLFDQLAANDYRSYGVSGNGFVSASTNLHRKFDELQYTAGQGPFLDGLTIYSHVFGDTDRDESLSPVEATMNTVRAVLGHDHPLKSCVNFGAVGLNRLAEKVPPLQKIPHTVFNPYQPFSYTPERNTRTIRDIFEREADREDPFFLFANYMDTHRPYAPPDAYQREELGETLSYWELVRLNDGVADPWHFATQDEQGTVDEEDLETVRSLYAGEVRSADAHLGTVLSDLERRGLYEDTLVIVTADHGENLGETDAMGRRRMGHESSMSDILLRVPLVVANPDLDSRTVSEYVSLQDLYGLLTAGQRPLLDSGGQELGHLVPDDGIVTSQYPAIGGAEIYDRHPDAPEQFLSQRVNEHAVAGYTEGWRVVVQSTGEDWAWHEGTEVRLDDAPRDLVERCRRELDALATEGEDDDLSDSEISQLEALGYI